MLHPGWISADMGGPDAPLDLDETSTTIASTSASAIASLTLADTTPGASFAGMATTTPDGRESWMRRSSRRRVRSAIQQIGVDLVLNRSGPQVRQRSSVRLLRGRRGTPLRRCASAPGHGAAPVDRTSLDAEVGLPTKRAPSSPTIGNEHASSADGPSSSRDKYRAPCAPLTDSRVADPRSCSQTASDFAGCLPVRSPHSFG